MKKIITSLLAIALVIGAFQFAPKAHACFFCGSTPDTSNVNTYEKEQAVTELNQRVLDIAQPIPKLQDSNERANLIKRLTTFNNPNKVSYIYLISYGKVMAFYTIKGKVSSVDSMLTDPTQLIYGDGSPCDIGSAGQCYQVQSPDLDGSYGTNGNGVFFFTTAGAYVEWNGEYMLADQPLQLTNQPELVQTVDAKGK